LGLVEGWTGTIRLFGRDRRSWGQELYDRIGVAFELPAGYPRLSAREDLLHFANLHHRPSCDIDQLDAADEPVGSYSKGMRIRLNLARAMLHQPELLFLDEPTGGLDPVNAARVRDAVRAERGRGATVFLTTHDMRTADELCDRVAFVVDGRIEACDDPRVLRLAYGQREVRVEHRTEGGTTTESFPLHPPSERLLSLLSSGEVETIHTAEATLDDVFVAVTGRDL
jgi:fluoroquinolone transport system ATP-binding protein